VIAESIALQSIAKYLALHPDAAWVNNFLQKILAEGGKVYLVGGLVRDALLGRVKEALSRGDFFFDIDFEVAGIEEGLFEEFFFDALSTSDSSLSLEERMAAKKFGVYRQSDSIEWSLPRKDGVGSRPKIKILPNMPIEESLGRRDFTINAMAIKMPISIKSKIIDPFGGLQDLKKCILAPLSNNLFLNDPRRFYRAIRFIGKLGFEPDERLKNFCKKMSLKGMSKEIAEKKLKMAIFESEKPSRVFQWLDEIGRLKDLFGLQFPYNDEELFAIDRFIYFLKKMEKVGRFKKRDLFFVMMTNPLGEEGRTQNIKKIGRGLFTAIKKIDVNFFDLVYKRIKENIENFFDIRLLAYELHKKHMAIADFEAFFFARSYHETMKNFEKKKNFLEEVGELEIYKKSVVTTYDFYEKIKGNATAFLVWSNQIAPIVRGNDILQIFNDIDKKDIKKYIDYAYEKQISIKKSVFSKEVLLADLMNVFKKK